MTEPRPTVPPTPPSAPPARVGRWLRVALVLSLTGNLLVLGLAVGATLGHRRDIVERDVGLTDLGFGPFLQAMPRSDRLALGRALLEHSGSLRENREALRREFNALLAALRADPFDIDRVKAALSAQQVRLRDRQQIGEQVLYDRLTAMTVADRRGFADRLERGLRRPAPLHHD